MASKEALLVSLIEEQKALAEQAQAVAIINQNDCKSSDSQFNLNNENEHEYVYWARRGELDTAVEVEICTVSDTREGEHFQIFS